MTPFRYHKRLLPLLLCWPLLAAAEPSTGDWKAVHCPGAVPAEENPYESRMIDYTMAGDEKKSEEMTDKAYRYGHCRRLMINFGWIGMIEFNAWRQAKEDGDSWSIEHFALENRLAKLNEMKRGMFSDSDAVLSLGKKLYRTAYSQEMLDLGDQAIPTLSKQYFCECLTIPVEHFRN